MVAGDMAANGNGAFDSMAQYARLSERVEGQGRDIVDLRSNMNTGFRNLEGSIHALSNELRGNSRTQWPVIWSAVGVCFAVIVGIGSAVYIPIREGITEAKADIRANSEKAMSVAAFTDFKATYENNRIVSRNEYLDKFNNGKEDLVKVETNLQRQVDELKENFASVYGARDIILDLRERLDRIEARRTRVP